MKRFSVFAAGLLFVWMLLPAMANAAGYVFSTGPVPIPDCQTGVTGTTPSTTRNIVTGIFNELPLSIPGLTILNMTATVNVYQPNCTASDTACTKGAPVFTKTLSIPPQTYVQVSTPAYPAAGYITGCNPFEVEVTINGAGGMFFAEFAMISVFEVPTDSDTGVFPVDARVLRSEMTVRAN